MTKDDKEIVSALRAAIAGKVGQKRYDLWFGMATRLNYDGHVLRIGAPNQFFMDWIRANFRRHIEDACHEVVGNRSSIEFQLDAASTESDREMIGLADSSGSKQGVQPGLRVASPREEPARPPESHAAPSRRRFASLESFVAGDANRLVIASAEMAVRRPGQLTPLMFYGPTGVGKTHLLEGVWTAVRKSNGRMTTIYLSAEQFTSQFLEALRGSGLPSFRRKYRGVGVLVLDDLQFFVGKRATQVELLHTIDTFLQEGRQLVFAADRSPADLPELGPELVTRLTSGLVCRIEPPDYVTRLGILAQMAKRMEVRLPADVQQFIASRLTSHARELSGAVPVAGHQPVARSADLAGNGRAGAGRSDRAQRPRGAAARHREGRLRGFRAGTGEPAIGRQREAREPSADAGDVAGPKAHAGRPERDRPLLRPPQP